jgi:hypothetical protein
MFVSLSPILSTTSYVFNSLVENRLFISLGGFLSSFKIKLTEPSYDGCTSICTGLLRLKFNNSVSKSTTEPASILLSGEYNINLSLLISSPSRNTDTISLELSFFITRVFPSKSLYLSNVYVV